MKSNQLSFVDGKGNPVSRIYHLVNSDGFLKDVAAANVGVKAAKRRVRKYLLEVGKLSKEGRKLILDSS